MSIAISRPYAIRALRRYPLHPRSPATFSSVRFSPEVRIRRNEPPPVVNIHNPIGFLTCKRNGTCCCHSAIAAAASPSPSPSPSPSASEIANFILSAAAAATAPDADAGVSFPLIYRLLAAFFLLLSAIGRLFAAIGLLDFEPKYIRSLLKNLFVPKSLPISPFRVIIYALVGSLIGFSFKLLFDLVGFVVEKLDATDKFMDSAVKMIIAISALKKIEMENEKAETKGQEENTA